jgi:hypothetical protein
MHPSMISFTSGSVTLLKLAGFMPWEKKNGFWSQIKQLRDQVSMTFIKYYFYP